MKNLFLSLLILSFFTWLHPQANTGSLTVICGSMYSGKSATVIEIVRRALLANNKVLVVKPAFDNRKMLDLEIDPLTYIPSRNGNWINCVPVRCAQEIAELAQKTNASIIVIDEVHFFTPEADAFFEMVRELVLSGKKVFAAGLELDFRGEPFGPMPKLLAYADTVLKLTAICSKCGRDTYCISQRFVNGQPAHYNDPLLVVGNDQYKPHCKGCHVIRRD
ncbi:MAG TPA: thymidine kinase [Candidatus Saccharimonadales bacterium]|nr:thymidine kinase [Candidatus Saccharimonadales bacterium]